MKRQIQCIAISGFHFVFYIKKKTIFYITTSFPGLSLVLIIEPYFYINKVHFIWYTLFVSLTHGILLIINTKNVKYKIVFQEFKQTMNMFDFSNVSYKLLHNETFRNEWFFVMIHYRSHYKHSLPVFSCVLIFKRKCKYFKSCIRHISYFFRSQVDSLILSECYLLYNATLCYSLQLWTVCLLLRIIVTCNRLVFCSLIIKNFPPKA